MRGPPKYISASILTRILVVQDKSADGENNCVCSVGKNVTRFCSGYK